MAPPSQKRPRDFHVLITGFGPFARTENNPSWRAVKPLNNTTLPLPNGGGTIHFTALEVQVTYAAVLYVVPGLHAQPPSIPPLPDLPPPPQNGYDFIFHVGLGRSGSIALEKLAHKTGYNSPDVDGKLAPIIMLDESGVPLRGFSSGFEQFAKEEHTNIDVDALVKHLQQTDEHVRVSTDPGRYLCDFIYYCSLAESRRRLGIPAIPVLFMHVPDVGEPHSVDEMTETVRKIVRFVIERQ
ncbi:peptidase C15, pyroglutamyl peptidase I-like protein [Exidia glandulosa HHB12029]|uniref:Peptidase C15, pyroglutamyl peptidase I-like protein n=1 Tax=Exidia glandulosa HHB12029 TaxID=1314781 RepID=A0A165H667_EXIGL|nr:peptidase C15, pyroglutamyl peptidase I-like protein [Exidia glandulosa HHB12029]